MNREDLLASLIVLAAKAGTRTFGIFNEDRVMLVRHGYLLALEELASEVGFHERAREDAEAAAKEDEDIEVRAASVVLGGMPGVYRNPYPFVVDKDELVASTNDEPKKMQHPENCACPKHRGYADAINAVFQEPKHSENCDCSKCLSPFQDPVINEEEK